MKVCAANHVPICHEGEACPLCLEVNRSERLQRELGALQVRLQDLAENKQKELMNRREACEFLAVGRRTFGRYIEAGWIGSKQVYTRPEILGLKDRVNRERSRAWAGRAQRFEEAA